MTPVGAPLGTHASCGGAVVLIQRQQSGYRLCTECGKRGGEITLMEELPRSKPTVKVTLSRKVRAFQYVSKLRAGYVIDPKEEQAIDDFAVWLQVALRHYDLDIEQVAEGWKVKRRAS